MDLDRRRWHIFLPPLVPPSPRAAMPKKKRGPPKKKESKDGVRSKRCCCARRTETRAASRRAPAGSGSRGWQPSGLNALKAATHSERWGGRGGLARGGRRKGSNVLAPSQRLSAPSS
jgi:hypothetical protein